MKLSIVKNYCLWTIEKDLEWYGGKFGVARFKIGDLVKTNPEQYSAGDDDDGPITYQITGYEIREDRDSGNTIGHEYTHRELYTVVNVLTRATTVVWPDEVETV